MEEFMKNNLVTIQGELVEDFYYNHTVLGEKFYTGKIKTTGNGTQNNVLNILVSERLVDITGRCVGKYARIEGQYRSYNHFEKTEGRNKLDLFVFARDFEFLDEPSQHGSINEIYLKGFACKPPNFRITPLGKEIADILLAVNRPYGKSDYIPCVCWGRNARFVSRLGTGTLFAIHGYIRSRNYLKKMGDDTVERRTAFEVSIQTIEVITDNEGERHGTKQKPPVQI